MTVVSIVICPKDATVKDVIVVESCFSIDFCAIKYLIEYLEAVDFLALSSSL